MSAHKVPFDLHTLPLYKDPGNAGSIQADRNPCVVPVISAGAETRTLAIPTRAGEFVLIYGQTLVGTVTLTVTSGYNSGGSTTHSLVTAGDYILLMSVETASGTYRWRKIADQSVSNILTPALAANTLTAAGLALTAADSGKTYFINNATGFVAATLPAVAGCAGCVFTFINKTPNTSGNHTIVTSGSENVINGNQNSVAGDAGDSGTTDDTISFVANQSVAGDKVEIFSDGVKFFAYAISRVAAGVTFTTAS